MYILVDVVKAKWQTLRGYYNRKLKQISGKTGQARQAMENEGKFMSLRFLGDLSSYGM